jgi:hypothetical protein
MDSPSRKDQRLRPICHLVVGCKEPSFSFLAGQFHFGNLIGRKLVLIGLSVSEAQQHGGRVILFRLAQPADFGDGFV